MRRKDPNGSILTRLEALEVQMAEVKTDVKWTRTMVEKLDARIWALLVGVAIAVFSSIVGAVIA
jgi:hypothetical protein